MAENSVRRGHRWFVAGCVILFVTAAAHTAAQLVGPGAPADESERELLRLMETHQFDLGGVHRTLADVMDGFGWFFSASLALLGAADVALLRWRRDDALLLHVVAGMNTLFAAVGLLLSCLYFPIAPAALFGLAAISFGAAWARIGR